MTNEERGTLEEVKKAAETGLSCISCGNNCIQLLWQIVGLCDAALSRPPRNCDVGTPEEQGERCLAQFEQWRRNGDGKKLITAIMMWTQMPYTAEEGGAK